MMRSFADAASDPVEATKLKGLAEKDQYSKYIIQGMGVFATKSAISKTIIILIPSSNNLKRMF